MSSILDYYKHSILSTAAYVRMGDSTDPGDFIQASSAADENRLPLSLARPLFDPAFAIQGIAQW